MRLHLESHERGMGTLDQEVGLEFEREGAFEGFHGALSFFSSFLWQDPDVILGLHLILDALR